MPPSWQAVPAGIRIGHSEGGPFFFAATTISCRRAQRPSASRSFPGVSLHRFPSLDLKSKIDARWRTFLGKTLQRFPYSPHEIRNRCNNDRNRRDKSSLRQRKLESDAEDRRRHACCRRNYSSLPLRKLESDAENRCLHDIAGETILPCIDFQVWV